MQMQSRISWQTLRDRFVCLPFFFFSVDVAVSFFVVVVTFFKYLSILFNVGFESC